MWCLSQKQGVKSSLCRGKIVQNRWEKGQSLIVDMADGQWSIVNGLDVYCTKTQLFNLPTFNLPILYLPFTYHIPTIYLQLFLARVFLMIDGSQIMFMVFAKGIPLGNSQLNESINIFSISIIVFVILNVVKNLLRWVP